MYIGVDVGGTKTAMVVTDGGLKTLSTLNWPTPSSNAAQIIGAIADGISQVVSSRGGQEPLAVGIGVPGLVSADEGRVLMAPNLSALDGCAIGPLLMEALAAAGVATEGVSVGNDADLAVLAEATTGAAAGGKVVIGLTIGTGVGGGIVIDGRPFVGALGGAGEFGHMTLRSDGPLCPCGNHGCLETLASGDAVVRHMHDIAAAKEDPSYDPSEFDTAAKVGRAAQSGDQSAARAYQVMGVWLGIGIANLVNIFAPDYVVVGGGVTVRVGDYFIPDAFHEARRRMLPVNKERVALVTASLGNFAGAVGAASLAALEFPGR